MVVTSRGGGTRTARVTARKRHRCMTGSSACVGMIAVGEVYLSHTCYPNHDAHDGVGPPWRGSECAPCARLYGRGDEIDPVAPGLKEN